MLRNLHDMPTFITIVIHLVDEVQPYSIYYVNGYYGAKLVLFVRQCLARRIYQMDKFSQGNNCMYVSTLYY